MQVLGGVTGSEVEDYHNWECILTRQGMMQYDYLIARYFSGCGQIIMVATLLWRGYIRHCQRKKNFVTLYCHNTL